MELPRGPWDSQNLLELDVSPLRAYHLSFGLMLFVILSNLSSAQPCTAKEAEITSFGASMIAQALGHRNIKFPTPRSISGRLLFWDHLQDQISYLLAPADEEGEYLVYMAGTPTLCPPDNPAPEPSDEPVRKVTFDLPLDASEKPILDLDEEEEMMSIDDSPFSFLHLSSTELHQANNDEDPNFDDFDELTRKLMQEEPGDNDEARTPEQEKKQATTHISVS